MRQFKDLITSLMDKPAFKSGNMFGALIEHYVSLIKNHHTDPDDFGFLGVLKSQCPNEPDMFNLLYLQLLLQNASEDNFENLRDKGFFAYPNSHIGLMPAFISDISTDANISFNGEFSTVLDTLIDLFNEFPDGTHPSTGHEISCPACHGTGTVTTYDMKCEVCKGEGKVKQTIIQGKQIFTSDVIRLQEGIVKLYPMLMQLLKDYIHYLFINVMYKSSMSDGSLGSVCRDGNFKDYGLLKPSGLFMLPGKFAGTSPQENVILSFPFNGTDITFQARITNEDRLETPVPEIAEVAAKTEEITEELSGHVRRFISADIDSAGNDGGDVDPTDELFTYTRRDSTVINAYSLPLDEECYEAFSSHNPSRTIYFSKDYGRDRVRQATAGILKVKKAQVNVSLYNK